MIKPKTGLVGVASHFESGGERAADILTGAEDALKKANLEVVVAKTTVWDSADAIKVCEQFAAEGVESLIIVDITWVTDSLKYIFMHKLRVPTVFWAVPYTETFSIGCIQHFGSILKSQGIAYQFVYGLPDNDAVIQRLKKVAQAGHIINNVRHMNLALLGPRQTWRVAGPQDMTNEEWEFSSKFGPTLVHIEMDEIFAGVAEISDEKAEQTLIELSNRTGNSVAPRENMLYMAKVYLSVKELIQKYNLTAIAAECYPQFSGLMNLPSSWMADEGFVLDTEGDISHTMLMYILNLCAQGGAVALGEVGSFDTEKNILAIAHEGSTAHSMAEDIHKVQISPSGEKGAFVGLPVKPMPVVTVANFVGAAGSYKVMIAKGKTLPVTHEEWVAGGSKLTVNLQFDKSADAIIEEMMGAGLDHHLLIKEDDFTELLGILCGFMGVTQVRL